MIPGLSLIGEGTDSCIVDSRGLVSAWNDVAVEVADSSLLKGFKILVSNNSEIGDGNSRQRQQCNTGYNEFYNRCSIWTIPRRNIL